MTIKRVLAAALLAASAGLLDAALGWLDGLPAHPITEAAALFTGMVLALMLWGGTTQKEKP